eukprot:SAG11_NODE_2247_length_3636_cov_3.037037_4_plen_122_part_00
MCVWGGGGEGGHFSLPVCVTLSDFKALYPGSGLLDSIYRFPDNPNWEEHSAKGIRPLPGDLDYLEIVKLVIAMVELGDEGSGEPKEARDLKWDRDETKGVVTALENAAANGTAEDLAAVQT